MKINFTFLLILIALTICNNSNAQNTFPVTGRVGIYTTSPAASLHVRGGARLGTTTNYVNIDSATGNLNFVGTSAYRVAGNAYAFQYAGNPNYGLYFNQTSLRYEFRTSNASPVFYVGANTGNGVFTGGVQVGNSTSNVAGNIRWTGTDFQGYDGSIWKSLTTSASYTGGTGISISNNTITNTAPDQVVTIAPATNMTVIGTYPNFALGFYIMPWFSNGNSGTDPSVNFIGTTDAQALAFKVNNQKSGWIDYTGNSNTSFGYQGLLINTTGFLNTALGHSTLKANITGSRNTAIGAYTLVANTADNNTAVGVYALSSNTSGTNNAATGVNALQANTTGSNNVANGVNSLYTNTTGQQNTANGFAALTSNSTGSYNTAIGSAALNNNTADYNTATGAYALYLNTSGTNNTASGYNALYQNTTGNWNTASGVEALASNTIGVSNTANGNYALHNNLSGNYNSAIGAFALTANTTGGYNTANGNESLYSNTTGSYNTANGYRALSINSTGGSNTANGHYSLELNVSGNSNTAIGSFTLSKNSTGNYNTAVGYQAGQIQTGNQSCTFVGYGADASLGNRINATAIGFAAIVDADNKVSVGNTNVTSIGGYAGWTTFPSDQRFKKQIKEDVKGLEFILRLRPVTYALDLHGLNKKMQIPDSISSKFDHGKENLRYTGFIAQEVEAAAKNSSYDFSGVDKPQTKDGLYGLRYSDFVVPLVKAVQELSKMNDDKDTKITDLQKQIDELKAMITSIQPQIIKQQAAIINNTTLEQNIPNPFANATTINYTLPQTNSTAQIIIRDKTGKTLKTINVSGSGKGSLKVDAATLASGAYSYSLIVNGKLINTKQMILAK